MSKVSAIVCASVAAINVEASYLRGVEATNEDVAEVTHSLENTMVNKTNEFAETAHQSVHDNLESMTHSAQKGMHGLLEAVFSEEKVEEFSKTIDAKSDGVMSTLEEVLDKVIDNSAKYATKVEHAGADQATKTGSDLLSNISGSASDYVSAETQTQYWQTMKKIMDDPEKREWLKAFAVKKLENGEADLNDKLKDEFKKFSDGAAEDKAAYVMIADQFIRDVLNNKADLDDVTQKFAKTVNDDFANIQKNVKETFVDASQIDGLQMAKDEIEDMGLAAKIAAGASMDQASFWQKFRAVIGWRTEDEILNEIREDMKEANAAAE